MHQKRVGARAEYLQEEKLRIQASTTLAEKFPDLRSLSATIAYFVPNGLTQHSQLKCNFNLAHAKSAFCFECPNEECVGGSFDLSGELAAAVAAHRGTAIGEARCPGWQSKTTIDRVHCGHVLRYNISLEFASTPVVTPRSW